MLKQKRPQVETESVFWVREVYLGLAGDRLSVAGASLKNGENALRLQSLSLKKRKIVSVEQGLPPELVEAAARLVYAAFREKLMPILGNDASAIAPIESSLNPRSCLCAVENGELLGVLALRTASAGFLNPSLNDLQARYGFWAGAIKAMQLSLLEHSPEPKELYIEAIAVADRARGKGIGTQLVEEAIAFASQQGLERVTLQVVDTNPRALKLYERLGFQVEKRSRAWPYNRLNGWTFSAFFFMARSAR